MTTASQSCCVILSCKPGEVFCLGDDSYVLERIVDPGLAALRSDSRNLIWLRDDTWALIGPVTFGKLASAGRPGLPRIAIMMPPTMLISRPGVLSKHGRNAPTDGHRPRIASTQEDVR